jgi:hypothetical protein
MVVGIGIIFAGILARKYKFVLDFKHRPCEIQNGRLLKTLIETEFSYCID